MSDVELIVRPSTVLYFGLAESLSYAGCVGIKVPFNLTNYDGASFVYEDPTYGVIEDTYDVVSTWNGTYILIAPRTCIPFTDGDTGTIRVTFAVTKYLELYLNETISQNWRFSDLQTFEALGSFTREFRVPATQNNCEAIGYLTDVNIDAEIDYFQVKLPAEIRVQTLPIAFGYLRVMRVITQADKLADFEVTFYAESPDLFNKISGKKLKDIRALADLNVVLDYDEVMAASGYPYLYSLTDYGQKWSEAGEEGTRSIYDETVTGCVRAGDLTPSLCWQWIFEKIITEAGFTYTGVTLDNQLFQYYAPWINSASLNFVVNPTSALFGYYLNTPINLTSTQITLAPITEAFDNGGNLLGAVYTAPADGVYYFRVWFSGFINGLGGVLIRGYNITTATTIELYQQPNFTNVATHYDSTNTLPGIQLSAGDQFEIRWRALGGAGASIDLDAGASYDTGTGVELYNLDITDQATLDWSKNAPDITQADFLRDVFNMHCCVLIPDRNIPNALFIEPVSEYIQSGGSRDWSRKLDISKDITISNTSDFQSKRMKFTYSAGEDEASKVYVGLNRIYGDYEIENYTVSENDVPNDFASDSEQKIQLNTQSTPCNYIRDTSVIIPKFVDDEGNFVSPGLRCLFNAGVVEMTLWNSAGNFPDTAAVIPILNHYQNIIPFFTDQDLNWAPEVPLYIIGPAPYKNLFNEYWRDYLNQLYSPQARIMEAYFALDLSDILSFKFNDRIWIKNAYWRILEITDYKIGSAEVTKVTLLKLIDAVPETSVRPGDVTSGGVIEFVDGDGNPAAATKSACTRFGYQWDEVNNTCYAFTTSPQKPASLLSTRKIGTSTREVSNAENTIVMADRLDNNPTNVYSLAVGTDIKMEANNPESIAVGEKLTKEGEGSVAMFGKNVFTNVPGFHLGGGYRDGDSANTTYEGWAQYGVVVLHRKQAFTASGDVIVLDIQGVNGWYLNLPTDTAWSCVLNVMLIDDALTIYYGAQINFTLLKTGGMASYSGVTAVSENGVYGGHTFGVNIDTTTNTDEHRIEIESTGGTYPLSTVVTASLTYQQTKIA